MTGQTFAEKVLSAKSGKSCKAGDIVTCNVDLLIGTDGSTPMAIDRFAQMGGRTVVHPERVLLSRDHYAPPTSDATKAYHTRMERFASNQNMELLDVGDGIGFLVTLEKGRVEAGDLVIGADSHTVTCGAVGAFATGVGSTDLAAAFFTGKAWLRVPATKRVILDGQLTRGVSAKDVALEVLRALGPDGATYDALEYEGPVADALDFEGRMVVSNSSAETGAKIGVFPTSTWRSDDDARCCGEIRLDCANLEPLVALPHDPANAVPVSDAAGAAVDWVLLGTCNSGFTDDLTESARIIESNGGIAAGVTVVVAPATHQIRSSIEANGTLQLLKDLGALVTETGCGPCCGTSAPIPPAHARIISTANRNYRGRMGQPSAEIYLASAITCAVAATKGRITDPRELLC